MIGQEISARKISLTEVGSAIKSELKIILDKEIECIARQDDYDYWGIRFLDYEMPIAELEFLLTVIEANAQLREESIPLPQYGEETVVSIGMDMARELLGRFMNCKWLYEYLDTEFLYLLEITEQDNTKSVGEISV